MGAFFLHELDEKLGKLGLFYIRFMTNSSSSRRAAGDCEKR